MIYYFKTIAYDIAIFIVPEQQLHSQAYQTTQFAMKSTEDASGMLRLKTVSFEGLVFKFVGKCSAER